MLTSDDWLPSSPLIANIFHSQCAPLWSSYTWQMLRHIRTGWNGIRGPCALSKIAARSPTTAVSSASCVTKWSGNRKCMTQFRFNELDPTCSILRARWAAFISSFFFKYYKFNWARNIEQLSHTQCFSLPKDGIVALNFASEEEAESFHRVSTLTVANRIKRREGMLLYFGFFFSWVWFCLPGCVSISLMGSLGRNTVVLGIEYYMPKKQISGANVWDKKILKRDK